MTFAVLRALHNIIGDALDEIEQVYNDASAQSASVANSPSPLSASPTKLHSPTTNNLFPANGYASPPPSPSIPVHSHSFSTSSTSSYSFPRVESPNSSTSTAPASFLDFPSLDLPYDAKSSSESLTSHPAVTCAINRIVAAAGQISATVQTPFLTLCDASMGYHLPSCLRLLEASHIVELLREAGPDGLHVNSIAQKTGVERSKLAHVLRLLATHHILRELSPDVFVNNRLSSTIDSGKAFSELHARPEAKYEDTNGIAAFVGLCTDELQKASAYLTEAYLLAPESERNCKEPTQAAFNYAFGCEGVGYFGWLEGEGIVDANVNGPGRAGGLIPGVKRSLEGPPIANSPMPPGKLRKVSAPTLAASPNDNSPTPTPSPLPISASGASRPVMKSGDTDMNANPNQFRLERFGKAMSGTESWEVPGAVLNGFDWHTLPPGSLVVDVGGGIGSTSMLLASAFSYVDEDDADSLGLKFVIQDREVVVEMGEKAWQAKCPELLQSGVAKFQIHDFFTPQPIKNAAIFLLRVILHDWPDAFARRILLRLREAASEQTKLLIADFIVPLACADDFGTKRGRSEDPAGMTSEDEIEDLTSFSVDAALEGVEGAERVLAPAPLLANLGKASANVYWMDLTMQVTFNGQERTLREVVALCQSTGWKVTKVVKAPGSLFGHITAIPAPMPVRRVRVGAGTAFLDMNNRSRDGAVLPSSLRIPVNSMDLERPLSRCATPTFGSSMELPSYDEAKATAKFRGGFMKGFGKSFTSAFRSKLPGGSSTAKKKPSPLSLTPSSPAALVPQSPVAMRGKHASVLKLQPSGQSPSSPRQSPVPPSSPLRLPRFSLGRRSSFANLPPGPEPSPPPLPSNLRTNPSASAPPTSPSPSSHTQIFPLSPPSPLVSRLPFRRRGSVAQLTKPSLDTNDIPPSLPTPMSMASFSSVSIAGSGSAGSTYGSPIYTRSNASSISSTNYSPVSESSGGLPPAHIPRFGALGPPPPIMPRSPSRPHAHHHSYSLSYSPDSSPHNLPIPPVPQSPELPRRKSHVQLSPKSLSRMRSESVLGLPHTHGPGSSPSLLPPPLPPSRLRSTLGPAGGRTLVFGGPLDGEAESATQLTALPDSPLLAAPAYISRGSTSHRFGPRWRDSGDENLDDYDMDASGYSP